MENETKVGRQVIIEDNPIYDDIHVWTEDNGNVRVILSLSKYEIKMAKVGDCEGVHIHKC